ncbi:hypothetical protein KOR42_46480 [Thalassoglobus neptunius]|uniref:Uncharacterized protein n=1 Tax=Thalassoglobus neptunius TaxID=1938619 RepID=A0A5C5VXZ4_9PLAN|nr:hypothetical protein KOR42_46480 [Thalassoglobus neptunius]
MLFGERPQCVLNGRSLQIINFTSQRRPNSTFDAPNPMTENLSPPLSHVEDKAFDHARDESSHPTGRRKLTSGTCFAFATIRPKHLLAEEQVCQVVEVP